MCLKWQSVSRYFIDLLLLMIFNYMAIKQNSNRSLIMSWCYMIRWDGGLKFIFNDDDDDHHHQEQQLRQQEQEQNQEQETNRRMRHSGTCMLASGRGDGHICGRSKLHRNATILPWSMYCRIRVFLIATSILLYQAFKILGVLFSSHRQIIALYCTNYLGQEWSCRQMKNSSRIRLIWKKWYSVLSTQIHDQRGCWPTAESPMFWLVI